MAKDPYKYFRPEARELLQGLGQGVLELEKGAGSNDLVRRLLRLAHTLKGAARVVKQPAIADDAHRFEDLLQPHREGQPVPAEQASELLALIDGMTARLAAIDAPAPAAAPVTSPIRGSIEESVETVRVDLAQMDTLLEGLTEASVQLRVLRHRVVGLEKTEQLAGVLFNQLVPRPTADTVAQTQVAGNSNDQLRVRSLAQALRIGLESHRHDLTTGIDQVAQELADLRDRASQVRLLDVTILFGPLERTVRDAAGALGRKVNFVSTSGEIRLDAHVLSALRTGLIQIVKNAVAHGLESEPERVAMGKPATGTVTVTVERRGRDVAFICRDDGRGIDVDAVRRAAAELGLGPASGASTLEDAVRFIFAPGVSTSRTLDQVSGRGIGLDIVRDAIARLNGKVHVDSAPGVGTMVALVVPVTLSSISVLVVDAEGGTASVPLAAVRRIIRITQEEILRTPEGESVSYEGRVIPFLPLAQALRRPITTARANRPWSVMIIQADEALAAVGIDRLLGTAEAVVRAMPTLAPAERLIAGASLDAEGHPQLVLDAAGLVRAAAQRKNARSSSTGEGAVKRNPILIIDDSLTTRMLEQSILESAGYEVELATCAEEGMSKARKRKYSLFLVDVEMPGMNGFEFVEQTRADPLMRSTPAILVSSLHAPEALRRGELAGASAYIIKGEFDQGNLLRNIHRVIA